MNIYKMIVIITSFYFILLFFKRKPPWVDLLLLYCDLFCLIQLLLTCNDSALLIFSNYSYYFVNKQYHIFYILLKISN